MAIRIQLRRDTASNWTTNNPLLYPGEMGIETDTGKFKIGPAVTAPTVGTAWNSISSYSNVTPAGLATSLGDYVETSSVGIKGGLVEMDASGNALILGPGFIIEGVTDNTNETTLTVVDPTADRTITFPDATGTVALTTDITVSASSTNTFSNKSISLATNTVSGTTAEFNTALSDSNFVTTGDTGTVTSTMISDGTIVDGDINAAAAIAQSKIANLTTDLGLKAPLADPTFTGTISAASLTLSGDFTVNGTTTNINSTNLVIEDKNIVLGDTGTPTDTTADLGGITLKGQTDKTFNWVNATDAWTSSEHIDLASGKTLKYNGTDLVAAQSGNSGKYLTTDGTSTSWGTGEGYSAPTLGSTSIASGSTTTTLVGFTKLRSDQFTTLDADGYEVDLEAMQIMGAL